MESDPLLSDDRIRVSAEYGSVHGSDSDSGSRRFSFPALVDSPPVADGSDELYIQQAVIFIEDAIQYRSINHKVDSQSLQLYRWYYSRICQWGLGFAIAVLLALAFVEKPSSLTYTSDPRFKSKQVWEAPCGVTEAIEAVCLCIFIADVVVKSYLIGWDEFRTNKWLIGYIVVITVSVMDCALSVSMLCKETIRIRRLLRPFFLLQNSSLMKKTLKCIKRTLPEIASVILLLALHLCLFTMIGMLIFPKSEDPSKNGEWEAYFTNFPRALSSLLVLLTTANNPDVMVPAYSLNRAYSLFFILFSVCGTYILMNLLTAIIYNQFRGYLLMSVQASILRRRLGIWAAFGVMCCRGGAHRSCSEDHVEKIPVDTVLHVFRKAHMKSYYKQAVIKILQEVEQFSDGSISFEEFQTLFDELDKEYIKEHPPMPEYSLPFLKMIQKIGGHHNLTVFGNAVALTNVICICTILVLDSEKSISKKDDCYMEIINWVFIFYYLVEMVLKLTAFGWKGYVSYKNNIFDGFFTTLLLVLQISILATYRIPCQKMTQTQLGPMSLWEMVRLVNMLIVVRFLRIIPEIKLMALVASTLVDLVKNLRAFAGILLVVYYVYAVIGIWLFQGVIAPPVRNANNRTDNSTLECGSYEQLEYWPNNFDDFASTLVLLYDVMVVNNWQVFMDAYTRYTTEWSKVYFVSWWLTSSVMWVNLFVALILENFTFKWDKSHALSVSEVEQTRQETTVQRMFRDHIQDPTKEQILTELQHHRHLHPSTFTFALTESGQGEG